MDRKEAQTASGTPCEAVKFTKNNEKGSRPFGSGAKSTRKNNSNKLKKKHSKNQNFSPELHTNEPYVVIVKNAENDFSRIHEEALPFFLELTHKNSQVKRAPGSSYYNCKIRSETRTAEISFYGENELAYFRPVATKFPKNVKREKKDQKNSDVITAVSEVEEKGLKEERHFSTVEEMLSVKRIKDYYDLPLKYVLQNDGNAILFDKSAAEIDEKEVNVTDVFGGDTSHGLQEALVSASAEVTFSSIPGSDAARQQLQAKRLRRMLQPVKGFVTCWYLHGAQGLASQQHIERIPGEEGKSSEAANVATFRIVFANMDALLNARDLLDQVAADDGVHVSIKLSAHQEEAYKTRKRTEHAEEVAEIVK